MKKNAMATAVVAGLAGVAGIANISNAVNLNPDGLGQVLIFPYYTVNADNLTLISVVNTTNNAKAVKVRVLEGRNSREVLDFNLYLSEHDVWTAFLAPTPENFNGTPPLAPGGGALFTRDRSCTVPNIVTAGEDSFNGIGIAADGTRYAVLRPFAYTGPANDTGPQGIDRTREGYIEMIEMGTIAANQPAAAAVRHNAAGVPANCAYVVGSWFGGTAANWVANSANQMSPPSGGLFGGGVIINVNRGTMLSYNADAIDGFSDTIIHSDPGDLRPNLADANNNSLPPPAAVRSFVFNSGQLITSSFTGANAIDAVSSVFMHNRVFNEYNVEAINNSQSEWVLTFPTKRFYVDPGIIGSGPAIPPFTARFNVPQGGGACEPISLTYYDREERMPPTQPGGFSPPRPGEAGPTLCWEAQVLTFNQGGATSSAILGSTYARNIGLAAGFSSGWLNLGFASPNHISRPSIEGHRFRGLPVTGFWAWTAANNFLQVGNQTVLSNYGGLFRHRASRSCFRPNDAGPDLACS